MAGVAVGVATHGHGVRGLHALVDVTAGLGSEGQLCDGPHAHVALVVEHAVH